VNIRSLIDDIGRREQFLGGRDRSGLAKFDEDQGWRELLRIHQRNLQKLKEQAGLHGAGNMPIGLSNQIEAEEQEIQELQQKLQEFS
jgi:hypothetical protein